VKKLLFILFLPVAFIMAVNSTVFALTLGTNITIPDGSSISEAGWDGKLEDQEVEPGMVGAQKWDLEGFFLDGNILTLVGGYDFKKGVDVGYNTYDDKNIGSGDLFFNIHGVDNNTTSVYDYVFDLDQSDSTYDIYKLDNNSKFINSWFSQNIKSDPWTYNLTASGNPTPVKESLNFTYRSNLNNNEVAGMKGGAGTHYAMIFDLSSFAGLFDFRPVDFDLHYTMECGNDNILGRGTIPNPEPGTFLLLGFGLIGFGAFLRKQQQKR